MPRGKTNKKRGRPRKKDKEEEKRLAQELENLKNILEKDDEVELEEAMRELRAKERKQGQKIAEMEVKNKRLLMWVVIIFIMIVISVFWMMNLDNMIKQFKEGPQVEVKDSRVEQAKQGLTDTMKKIRQSIDEIQKQAKQLKEEDGIDVNNQIYSLPTNNDVSK